MKISIKKPSGGNPMGGRRVGGPLNVPRQNPINPVGPTVGGGAGVQNSPVSAQSSSDETLTMKIIDRIVRGSIFLTVFLLPLFFLPNVPSPLELNKQALLAFVTGIGFLAWVGKMAWRNEIRFKSGFILVPIMVFVILMALSTVFSNYTEQSLWGYFGGEGYSFISLLFMVALFLLIFNTIQNRKEAIKLALVFLVGGFLVSFFGILQIWGVYVLPMEAIKINSFNTIGSVYVFSSYVAALFLLTLAFFLGDVSKRIKIALIVLSFFFFFVLMVINFPIVWKLLMVAIALLLGITIIVGKQNSNQARILPMIFLILALFMVLYKKPIITKELPIEVTLNNKTSYKIALSSFKDNPLLGAGPANYAAVYKTFRPDNLGNFWSVNFTNGTSYFVTLMSTVGVLGTLGFIFLSMVGFFYLMKSMLRAISSGTKNESEDYAAVGIGVVWFFVTLLLFFYLANISILMLWWFSLALFLAFSMFDPRVKIKEFVTTSASPRSSLILSFVFVMVIIGFVAAIYLQSQKYVAAVHFNNALTASAQGETIDQVANKINQAVQLDSSRDVYYRNLAVAMFALANQRVAEKGGDLEAEDSNYVSAMIRGALQAAEQAKALDPTNSENYVALAQLYEGVLVTMEGADENAINNYQEAIKLDPNNPSLHYRIASIYVTLADVETQKAAAQNQGKAPAELPEEAKKYLALARESLDRSVAIKIDFASARLLYAGIYEREGQMDKAIEKERENKGIYPGDPSIALRLGLLYYKDEQWENAKKEFQYALSLDKNFANAMYFLGLTENKLGNNEAAIKQFERVVELNPENETVKKILDNLKAGREPLEGLAEGQPIEEEGQGAQPGQPTINPSVENQEIPEEAVPTPEEEENPEEQPIEPAPEEEPTPEE